MKMRSTIVPISIFISLIGMSLNTFAQSGNPLRSISESRNAVSSKQTTGGRPQEKALFKAARNAMTPEAYQAAFPHRSDQTNAKPEVQPWNSQSRDQDLIVDSNVHASKYEAETNSGLKPIKNLLDSLGQAPSPDPLTADRTSVSDVIERLNSDSGPAEGLAQVRDPAAGMNEVPAEKIPLSKSGKFDQGRFQSLLKQLATSTFLVMLVGVGFILVAKRWVKGSKPASKSNDLAIEIMSTLKLSPKSNLHLIQAGEQRLIVALDQNGINTVVPLNESFSNTLDSITEMANDLDSSPGPKADADSGVKDSGVKDSGVKDTGVKDSGVTDSGVTVSFSDSLLALARKKSADNERSGAGSSKLNAGAELDDDVRRKMEAALSDHGLKDLILQQLRTRR
jgi:flagellar biogenesis protein FliO